MAISDPLISSNKIYCLMNNFGNRKNITFLLCCNNLKNNVCNNTEITMYPANFFIFKDKNQLSKAENIARSNSSKDWKITVKHISMIEGIEGDVCSPCAKDGWTLTLEMSNNKGIKESAFKEAVVSLDHVRKKVKDEILDLES